MAKRRSVIRKGTKALPSAPNDGPFIGLKDGDQIDVVPLTTLDDMIAFDQHAIWLEDTPSIMVPCLQDETCPCCAIGNKSRYRAMLIVQVKGEDGVEEKVLPMGITTARDLTELNDTIEGGILGSVLRFKRSGSGLRTRYSLIPTGRKAKTMLEPTIDLEELAGPTDAAEIEKLLIDANLFAVEEPFDEDDDDTDDTDDTEEEAPAPSKKSRGRPAGKKAASKKAKDEDEDEDEDDGWD